MDIIQLIIEYLPTAIQYFLAFALLIKEKPKNTVWRLVNTELLIELYPFKFLI